MNDPSASFAQEAGGRMDWLMLLTSVPSKPDYLRVKLRRRIQRLGAVGLKGAVYVLPEGADPAESFEWLRQEIVADGGDATLCRSRLIHGMTDAELVSLFNRERALEYQDFVAACRDLEARWLAPDAVQVHGLQAERGRLERRLAEILSRDYFTAPEREDAMQAIERVAVLDIQTRDPGANAGEAQSYRKRLWATRAGVKVDRIASAWLIRRQIDPEATFVFVGTGTPPPQHAVPFDMFAGGFTHEGDRCTFEVLLAHFGITDAPLHAIGQMVHDIDLHEETFERPETAGFASMIAGIVAANPGDAERLDEGARMLDAVAAGISAAGKS